MKKIFTFVLALIAGVGTSFAIEGKLPGAFSISSTEKVQFSQGNLQYKAAPTPTWQFATNQWDTIGSGNQNISDTYEGWIDLFGWGTGANPTFHSEIPTEYSSFTDWGTNPISNGGNTANAWRTLSRDEWYYILNSRSDAALKQGQAVVNNVYGLVLLPDDWTMPAGLAFTAKPNNWTTNVYDATAWDKMAANGAVFLPYSKERIGTKVAYNYYGYCYYWSSTESSTQHAWEIAFKDADIDNWDTRQKHAGCCVRLVRASAIEVGDVFAAESGENILRYQVTEVAPNWRVKLKRTGHILANHKLMIPSSVEYMAQSFTVTEIENNSNFPGVDTITLPASLTTPIDFWYFKADDLKAFLVENGSTLYTSVEGVLYSADKQKLYRCPVKNPFNGTFASGVEVISNLAFSYCTELVKEIIIPNTVTSIGARGFLNTAITRIDIPASVTSLGDNTFGSCSSLAEVNFEDVSNLHVAWNTFAGAKILTDQTEDGLCHIGGLALGWNVTPVSGVCAWPDTLVIPEGIVNIGTGFSYNYGKQINDFSTIKQIVFPSTIRYVEGAAFGGTAAQKMANLEKVIMKSAIVPSLRGGAIALPHDGTLTLVVPCGAAETFKNSSTWNINSNRFDVIEDGLVWDITATAEHGKVAISEPVDCDQVTLTATADDGYVFDQWSNGATTAAITITVDKDTALVASFKQLFTVRFLDWDDAVLKTQQVVKGEDAVAPANPTREGWIFTGWDKEFTNIQADTDVKALYKQESTGWNNVQSSDVNCQKVVRDGQVLIMRDGKLFNLLGAEVR